jgi:outer membrane protein
MRRNQAMKFKWRLPFALCFGLSTHVVHAATLNDIWLAVSAHSPEAAAAMFAKEAGQYRLDQAKSLWRPQATLGAGAGQMNANSQLTGAHFVAPGFGAANGVDFNTSVRQGNASNWVLEIQQPLINGQLKAQAAQLKTSAQLADLEYAGAQNTLMLATVQQYFQWLLLNHQRESLDQHLAWVKQLSGQAQERFKAGDIPVTDMLEAQAQEQALEVQKTKLTHQIRNVQKILSDATGWPVAQWRQMGTKLLKYQVQSPQDLNTYQQQARSQNLGIRLIQFKLEIEQQQSRAQQWQSQPSLALVARAMQQRLDGPGDYGSSTLNNKQQYVGLQLNVPLYTGGYRSAKSSESLAQIEKLQMDVQTAALQVEEAVQVQWLRWQAHEQDLSAAQALSQAHLKRLQATQLAYEVGDRSLPELLHAQADWSQAAVNLYQQQLNVLLSQLSLSALQGPVDLTTLQAIDAQFKLD